MYPEQVNNNYEGDGVLLYGLQGTSFYKETKENKVMNEKEKQIYVEQMKVKALAYAENVSSDVKGFMSADDYQEVVRDIAQAFLCGADAALETIKELKSQKGE